MPRRPTAPPRTHTESGAVVGLSFSASPALGEDEALLPILAAALRKASRCVRSPPLSAYVQMFNHL